MADKKIILAVDDMTENLTLLRSMLEEQYDIRLAKSATMALSLLEKIQVDLLLLDIEMPGMTGFEFIAKLHASKYPSRDAPVIFVTSHASTDFITQAINSGAKDYLVKPIKADLLHKKIEALIGAAASGNIFPPTELGEKLKALLAAVTAAESAQSEALIKEIMALTEVETSEQNKHYMADIERLVRAVEYEQAIKKIKEFAHHLAPFHKA